MVRKISGRPLNISMVYVAKPDGDMVTSKSEIANTSVMNLKKNVKD